jgi:hypothetical protein
MTGDIQDDRENATWHHAADPALALVVLLAIPLTANARLTCEVAA